jgi:hypothetical protein
MNQSYILPFGVILVLLLTLFVFVKKIMKFNAWLF